VALQVNLTGKNMDLGDDLEVFIRGKFRRIDRFVPRNSYFDVVVSREPTKEVQEHYVAQANLIGSGSLVMRGEERAADPHVAVDTLVDRLEERLSRQHSFIESERRITAQGHLPPTPEEELIRPSTLEIILGDRGIDEETIAHLEVAGIVTLEQLRAAVDDGRLHARLGTRFRHAERELIKIVDQFRA
jgi:ribosomal subunit interface protein